MRCRVDHREHEKGNWRAVHSPLCRVFSILLFSLNITYFPSRLLEYIDLFSMRAVKPLALYLFGYIIVLKTKTRSTAVISGKSSVKREQRLVEILLTGMEAVLKGPVLFLESLDRLARILEQKAPQAALKVLNLYARGVKSLVEKKALTTQAPFAQLFRRPVLKSAVAMSAVLLFSLYSYAFNSASNTVLPVNASLAAPALTRQESVIPNAGEEMSALLSPPAPSPVYMDAYAPPDIERFRKVFDSKALVNISRGNRDVKEVSLTFDGGTANHAREILNILRAKEIKTTIFLTGRFIRNNPEIVQEIIAGGHEVGNHTMNHPHLTDFNKTRVHTTLPRITKQFFMKQILSTAKLYKETTGEEMAPFWRAPYGEVNPQLTQWAFEAGFVHVGWTADYKRHKTLDTLDWVADRQSKNYYTASEIRERILDFGEKEAGLKGGIILMHLGTNRRGDQAVSVLPAIIDDLRDRGYSFVKISKMAIAKFSPGSNHLDSTLALIKVDTPSL